MKGAQENTILQGDKIALKSHPRIALRGEIDALMAECLFCIAVCKKDARIYKKLCEIKKVVNQITRCEALGEDMEFCGVFGYSKEEIREISHFPQKFLGEGHLFLTEVDELSPENACLNKLRVKIRDCERAAVCVGDENLKGIGEALNCLSSAAYILMIERAKEEK